MAELDRSSSRRSQLQQSPEAEHTAPLLWPIGRVLLGAIATAALAVIGLLMVGWLLLDVEKIKPEPQLTPGTAFELLKLVFAVVAGLGAVVGLVVAYRRQRTTEAENDRAEFASVREDTRLFTERFTTAAGQLGEGQPAVRLAGVHALAHLADDAPTRELRQMCIDVLCAYLRMPYTPAPEDPGKDATAEQRETHRTRTLEFGSLRQVRHSILRIIGDRLREDTSWRGHDYDFTGVVFDGGKLDGAEFTGGRVDFSDAVFAGGRVTFNEAKFTGSIVLFYRARFTNGWTNFHNAQFTGGTVTFNMAEFTGGTVTFTDAVFAHGVVLFYSVKFKGGRVDFGGKSPASGDCPRGLFKRAKSGVSGVVRLPTTWERDLIVGGPPGAETAD